MAISSLFNGNVTFDAQPIPTMAKTDIKTGPFHLVLTSLQWHEPSCSYLEVGHTVNSVLSTDKKGSERPGRTNS